MTLNMTEYNHNKPLSDFMPDIEILRSFGYKPIAVTSMLFEDTFVFETVEEATKAYNQFEVNDSKYKISAWWYGKDDFLKEVEKYESELGVKVLVYDLLGY